MKYNMSFHLTHVCVITCSMKILKVDICQINSKEMHSFSDNNWSNNMNKIHLHFSQCQKTQGKPWLTNEGLKKGSERRKKNVVKK